MKTDIAIIGTGPGGSMAAYHLAKTGMKVVVLEKGSLPRQKACGGAIPAGMKTFFEWDITPCIEKKVSTIKFLYNHTMSKEIHQTEPIFLMVNRRSFDYHLINKAISIANGNITLLENVNAERIEENKNSVTIFGQNQETIKADFVIAADGAFSKSARSLGLNKNCSYGLAIDARVDVTPEIFELNQHHATFNFFCLPKGYGWIFPKNSYLSCGVGGWPVLRKQPLPKEMKTFLERSFPPGSIQSVKMNGHPIPIYSGHRDIATKRVCLVGDAANLVEPIMGEGIRFALKSAVTAADIIICLAGGKPDSNRNLENVSWKNGGCRSYQAHIHREIGADLDILYRYALTVFLDAPEFFYRKFIRKGYSYLSYFKNIALQLNAGKNYLKTSDL